MSNSRIYDPHTSVVFHKTKEQYGGLSNMAAGYSVNVNNVIFPTAEHLYQACRFPHQPQVQFDILNEPSPMKAKWVGRAHLALSRPDWNHVRFKIMRWCLEVKLSQNWITFGELLRSTGDQPIVEWTPKDKVWGATTDGDHLVGVNALGRLLMDLRERYVKTNHHQQCVSPLLISDFLLFGHPIDMVCDDDYWQEIEWSRKLATADE